MSLHCLAVQVFIGIELGGDGWEYASPFGIVFHAHCFSPEVWENGETGVGNSMLIYLKYTGNVFMTPV
jgi:hypothetical protein